MLLDRQRSFDYPACAPDILTLPDAHAPATIDKPRTLSAFAAAPSQTASSARSRITGAIRVLNLSSKPKMQIYWLQAIARLVTDSRPDLAPVICNHLGVEPAPHNILSGLTIGEIGVVYEALTALASYSSRREMGQYFTPDDVAQFMAKQAHPTEQGIWLDPCCGVGNLAFQLAKSVPDSAEFISNRLALIDIDPVALKTAQALLVSFFAKPDEYDSLTKLVNRSVARDYLSIAPLPAHDYVIFNPPYARTERNDSFESAESCELFAYFLEKVTKTSKGFVGITPAAYLSGKKYAPLREILEDRADGEVLVFDNVPDTCFRGYKYGSTNTSKTNFVRAAITISLPKHTGWEITPILRWTAGSRTRMWRFARDFLRPLRLGPSGEWVKLMPETENIWELTRGWDLQLRDLISHHQTGYQLQVASTPRYYVSASKRPLDRGSKHILNFKTKQDLDKAYVILNSSLPYWWWRCLDGGVTLPLRTLLSLPVPSSLEVSDAVVNQLEISESENVVVKLNAGRLNENIRHPRDLVEELDILLFGEYAASVFDAVYSPDLFSASGPSREMDRCPEPDLQ